MMARSKSLSKLLSHMEDLPYKLFYFMFYAGYMPLLLYLPVYFKYIGLSAVHVGILNGIRPILQSVGTPVLTMVGEKLHSRKLLFIISCIVMIGKVGIILLLLRPSHQVCTVEYVNETQDTTQTTYYDVEHKLSKRSVEGDWLPQSWHDATVKENIAYSVKEKRLLQRTDLKRTNDNLDKYNTTIAQNTPFAKQISNKTNQTRLNGSEIPSSNTSTSPALPRASHNKTTKNFKTEYHVVNDQDEVYRIFIVLLILVILGDWFDSVVFTLVDQSCVVNMEVENYGFIRLWGNLGWGIMTPVIGVIVYTFGHEYCGKSIGSFHYVFFFFIGFGYLALLIGSHFDFSTNPMDIVTNRIHDVQSNFQYGMFLFASAYSGFCNGFLFTFVNWFIDSLGGSALIMGIATGCKCVVDVLLFVYLGKIIESWGHVATMSVGFIGYIFVFLFYFSINQAWLVIIAETIHAIVYALMTSTSVAFLIYAAPAGSSPKLQGVLQGIYWGVGTGCGSIFGGYCVRGVGFSRTFLSFTVITCVVAFIFLVIQLLSHFSISNSEESIISGSSSDFGDDEGDTTSTESEHEGWDGGKLMPKN